MPRPELDRMAIDDVARTPELIAAEIHRQLGEIPPPVPVEAVARALDIVEIWQEPLSSFEGALLADPERNEGRVLINSRSHSFRRRYTLGHELGHFLCFWHKQTNERGFACTRQDMRRWAGNDPHSSQEAEANIFAIELLAPKRLLAPRLRRLPDLEHVVELSQSLQLSRMATARRYVALHRECLAVIFAKDGCFDYTERGPTFPWIPFSRGDRLPSLPGGRGTSVQLSEVEEADPQDWLQRPAEGELAVQVLNQDEGHATVLLHLSPEAGEEDPL